MKKCLLCERKMNGNGDFGKICLKSIYQIMGIYDSKSVKNEIILEQEILKICHKRTIARRTTYFTER